MRLEPRGKHRRRKREAELAPPRAARVAAPLIALATFHAAAAAQVIRVPTISVSPDHQFEIFPSAAMGGVSIAVEDPRHDPFVNPAKGSRTDQPHLFTSLVFFGDSDEAGGGWTLPVGAAGKAGPWFGGLYLGLQGLDDEPDESPPLILDDCLGCAGEGVVLSEGDASGRNRYGFLLLGRELEGLGLSLGGSVLWSGLEAMDGVDLLYPGSVQLDQSGALLDIRLGALEEWGGGRTLEVLTLYNRFGATHEALYADPLWDPGQRAASQRFRLERTSERTHLWGLHVEYERPLGEGGWRIGWLGTLNHQSHPSIPRYEIASVSKDRGRSTALDLGVGVSRSLGTATFGADLIYEPIWSRSWAVTSVPVEGPGGDIPAGGDALENRYRFSNALVRIGIGDEAAVGTSTLSTQFGISVRAIRYRLSQRDHVRLRERTLRERWIEWTPTWALALRMPGFEVRYRGQLTSGIHQPGLSSRGGSTCFGCLRVAGVEPTVVDGPVPFGGSASDHPSVSVHQISFSFPLGSRAPVTNPRGEGAAEESR